jgi:hypothetical protein
VIVGTPATQKRTLVSSVQKMEEDRKAQPEIGMDLYKKYLKEEAILPNNYDKKKQRIKISFTVNESGHTTNFRNVNGADSVIFKKAIEIIENGPMWQAEIKNGKAVSSEMTLKIIFRIK